MDSRDGFDIEGLPLDTELWAAQQLQADHLISSHSNIPSSLYQGHIPQVTTRDFAPMSLTPSFSTGSSSYGHPQQMLLAQGHHQGSHPSVPKNPTDMSNFASSHSVSADRSAWNLFSLDPTLASMNPLDTQSSQRHSQRHSAMEMLSSHKPHVDMSTTYSRANTQPPITNVGLPGTPYPVSCSSFPSSMQSEYPPYSHHGMMRDHVTTQLNQFMNVPKTSMIPKVPTLTVDTNVPLMQASSYSPVSPPAPDQSADFSNNTPRIAEFLLKSSHHSNMMSQLTQISSRFPNEVQRSSLEHRPEKFSNSSVVAPDTLDLSSQSLTSSAPTLLSPSDMPIDMTTALNSRTSSVKHQDDDFIKHDCETNKGVSNISTDLDIGTDRTTLLQSLLTKQAAAGLDKNKPPNSSEIPIATSKVKTQPSLTMPLPLSGKPPKSTLKKSDFYGRDASHFSFTNDSINTEPVDKTSHPQLSTINKNTIPSTTNPVINTAELSVVKNQVGNTFKDNQPKFTSETDLKIEEADFANEDFSINDKSSDLSPSFEHSADSFIEACTAKDVPEAEVAKPALKIDESSETKMADESIEAETEDLSSYKIYKNLPEDFSDESNATIIDLNEDLEKVKSEETISVPAPFEAFEPVIIPSVVSVRGGRGKRKRGGGRGRAPARQRKRGGKRGGGAAAILKNLEIDMVNGLKVDTITESLSETSVKNQDPLLEDKEAEPQDIQSKNEENGDKAPRRSSNRKSKDTAKRLIELQADSGYSGTAQTSEDTKAPVPTTEGRKGRKRKSLSYAEEVSDDKSIDNESTDDGESKDKDDDYLVDEEEAAVVENEEDMDSESPTKRPIRDKKAGGLKISIKLSSNSKAEIVSGIATGPKKKKRKIEKVKEAVKSSKTMKKRKVAKTVAMIYSDDDSEPETDQPEKIESPNNAKKLQNDVKIDGANNDKDTSIEKSEGSEDKEVEDMETSYENEEESESPDNLPKSKKKNGEQNDDQLNSDGKPLSLMEKYFSVANSATAAKLAKINDTPTKRSKAQQSKKKVKPIVKKSESDSKDAIANVVEVKKADGKKVIKKVSIKDEAPEADTELPKFVCGYCPQRYHTKQDLLAHVVDHMNEMEVDEPKPKPISKDTKETKKLSEKSAPVVNEKGPPNKALPKPISNSLKGNKDQTVEKQKFKCGECGETFPTKTTLLEHVRIHTADKPFECDICHKCFTERNMLSVHRKTHLQDALFRCQLCSKAFSHRSDLDTHMQSHPKRSGNAPLPKKPAPVSKPLDKLKNHTDKTDAPKISAPVKPKSFSLALGGEPDVIILKRGESSSSASKSVSQNSKANEVQSVTKEKAISITLSKSVESNKSVSMTNASKSSIVADKKLIDVKAKSAETSDVCSCNECPECVTRFLADFD